MIHVYSDGSFSKRKGLGVVGCLVFTTNEEHELGVQEQSIVHTRLIEESSNIRVELKSVMHALEFIESSRLCQNKVPICMYTDCKTIAELPTRKERLEHADYRSTRTGKILSNADLYQDFFQLHERLKPRIVWVKGHCAKANRGLVEENFAILDKIVRKRLRNIV